MFVGEAPGEKEDRAREPFVGMSGNEVDRYCRSILLAREDCFIANLLRYRPDNNADPTEAEILRDEQWLMADLIDVQPQIVVTLGRFSTRWFLGRKVSMDREWGLAHSVDICQLHGCPVTHPRCLGCSQPMGRLRVSVVPIHHPALGLYSPDKQSIIQAGFDAVGRLLRGEMPEREDAYPNPVYAELRDGDDWGLDVTHGLLGMDTEGSVTAPWCLSLSGHRGTGYIVRRESTEVIEAVCRSIEAYHVPVVWHFAMHDLEVIEAMGIDPTAIDRLWKKRQADEDDISFQRRPWWLQMPWHDTMVMAFNLGPMYPQALKVLSYRLHAMEMDDYESLTAPAEQRMAIDYMRAALAHRQCPDCRGQGKMVNVRQYKNGKVARSLKKCSTCDGDGTSWPRPEPVLLWDSPTGKAKIYQPQSIGRRLRSMLSKAIAPEMLDVDEDDTLYDAWRKVDPEEVREIVETELGPMPTPTMDGVPLDVAIHYASRDADATLRAALTMIPLMEEAGVVEAYRTDMSIIPIVLRMQQNGMLIDCDYFHGLVAQWRAEMDGIVHQLKRIAGYYVNPGSSKQMANFLFDRLGLPTVKKTKSKENESTDDKVLEQLKILTSHPSVDLIMRYRELSKLVGTYALPLAQLRSTDGRVRTQINITRTATGRLSSSKRKRAKDSIQLQNIPTRSEEGRKIRGGFVARPGYLLGSWDLDQVEMRVMAHCTQDENLLRLFNEGATCPVKLAEGECRCHDIHRLTASLIWKVPIAEVTSTQRSSAKNVGFGMIYGITAQGLRTQFALRGIEITEAEAQALIDSYLKVAYPGIMRFWERKFTEARRYGYVRSQSGRIRHVAAVQSAASWVREEAQRQAGNYEVQEFAGHILKKAMGHIWDYVLPPLWERGWDVQPLMQIHDELLFEFPEGLEDLIDPMIRRAMTETVRISVPLGCKGKWGKRWSELKD